MTRSMCSSCPATISTRWTTPTCSTLHKETGAACTICRAGGPLEEATRFGIMNVDEHDHIYEFEEKPKQPKSNLASMGIYIFTWSKLREYLIARRGRSAVPPTTSAKTSSPTCSTAGEHLTAYRFQGYWKDVGTIDSLWDANMDMLAPRQRHRPLRPEWPIYARTPIKPPHFTGPGRQGVPLHGHRRLRGLTARWKTPCSSTPSWWRRARWCATPSSCPARWSRPGPRCRVRHRGREHRHRRERPGGRRPGRQPATGASPSWPSI